MSTLLGYRRTAEGIDPPYDHGAYASTHKRAPKHSPIRIAHTLSEITGPRLGAELVGASRRRPHALRRRRGAGRAHRRDRPRAR